MTPPPFERRRAEDVFRVVEEQVFPRLGAIDTKITSLEQGIQGLTVHGCAQRTSDLHRVEAMEQVTVRIFEKIDDIGSKISDARVQMVTQVGEIKTDVQRQVGGIKAWVLTGVVLVLLAVAGFFLEKHYSEKYDRPATMSQGASQ